MITLDSIRDSVQAADRCADGICDGCPFEHTAARQVGDCTRMLIYRLKVYLECLLLEVE